MKTSIFTSSLIVLAIATFSVSAQAEKAQKTSLSMTVISADEASSLGSHSVSKGSSITTTVTMGSDKTAKLNYDKNGKVIIQQVVTNHKIEKGDTLSGIAEKYGTTVAHIMKLNKLKSTTILLGQILKL